MRSPILLVALVAGACGKSGPSDSTRQLAATTSINEAFSHADDAIEALDKALQKDLDAACLDSPAIVADTQQALDAIAAIKDPPEQLGGCVAALGVAKAAIAPELGKLGKSVGDLKKAGDASRQWDSCGAIVDAFQSLQPALCKLESAARTCNTEASNLKGVTLVTEGVEMGCMPQ